MNLADLIEELDQRYGNPYAKECALIQEAIKVLREMKEELEVKVVLNEHAQQSMQAVKDLIGKK